MKKPIALSLTDTHLEEKNITVVKSIFQQATAIAKELGLTQIEHKGDIFHARKGQLQINLTSFKEILNELHASGMMLNQVIGNHDKTEYSITESFIDPYEFHPALNMYRTSGYRQVNDQMYLAYLSFFTDEKYIHELDRLKRKLPDISMTALLTHIGVAGAVMNNGTVIHSESVVPSLFREFATTLIGHYHDSQILGDGKIQYTGASLQHNFGELTGKGAIILYDDFSTEVRPLVYPQYIKYEVNPKDITATDLQAIKDEKASTGDNLRIILTGTEAEVKSFNKMDLLNAGISVEMKQDRIEAEEIETTLHAFDTNSLNEEFKAFCDKNKLDMVSGMKYFDLILKAAV